MQINVTENKPNKKKFNNKKILMILAAAIPVLFLINYVWVMGQADFSINRSSLTIGEVKRGNYTVSVRGTGLLVPDKIHWLAAMTDATVVRVVLKAGNIVKEGDLIVEMTNPQLIQQLAEEKWELEALTSEHEAARVAQETQLLEMKSNLLNLKLAYEHAVNEYNAHEELIQTNAVSKLDYQRSKVEMDQTLQRWESAQEEYKKSQENLKVQNIARSARLNKTKKSVERIQQQVDALMVIATMDGTIQEVPLDPGQRVRMGDNIAKLSQRDSLIAELQVPEIQIRDVAIGQHVTIDTRNSKIEGIVSRIDPAVINGNVQVDVAFTQELPDDARPDLSVDGEIKITEIEDALYVERPLFAQSRSQSSLYRLTDGGEFAERVEVQLGYGSVSEIQVLDGLQVGDRVVISDPTRFESYNKFRIN
ncbi:HlyD family efflux transporter periplasmic adaptor subunit [Paraneptunicella aestuarii]|uniref:efflux RND transporter periplasmic adaptor subunit n=1 Tax=Paraneptunicella aestuarii TaxID=2831148 RepID=UPI001E2E6F2D|nr:HlyD family efflux transporter periplasmic adaptor subunit [Paraneptunicella aestuarii]UAA40357.1 HlyD family efflux transporter periplasmic adaptor subunit [Paraneptunicella aestuarii]